MSYQTRIEELRNFDIGDITDLDTVGEWPNSVKMVLSLMVFIACLAAGYYLRHLNSFPPAWIEKRSNQVWHL